jgi:hypothetical protein
MDPATVPDWIKLRQQPGSGFSNSLDPDPDSAKCLDPDPKHFVLTANKFLNVLSDTEDKATSTELNSSATKTATEYLVIDG